MKDSTVQYEQDGCLEMTKTKENIKSRYDYFFYQKNIWFHKCVITIYYNFANIFNYSDSN